jgi:TetR/AcrR family transcriptional regulator, transcriptional repressor for nem operon
MVNYGTTIIYREIVSSWFDRHFLDKAQGLRWVLNLVLRLSVFSRQMAFDAVCLSVNKKYELCYMPRLKAFDENDMIEKAKNLFQLKGYEGTSMQDLIDTLGISRSSLYDSFGDKHQLYLKTLNTYCEANVYALIEQAKTTDNPLAFIQTIFTTIIEQTEKDREKKGCYVVNAVVEFGERNPDVYKIVEANNKAFEKMLENLIIKAQAQKQIATHKNAQQLAKFLFTIICGLRVNAKSKNGIKDLNDVVKVALGVLAE